MHDLRPMNFDLFHCVVVLPATRSSVRKISLSRRQSVRSGYNDINSAEIAVEIEVIVYLKGVRMIRSPKE